MNMRDPGELKFSETIDEDEKRRFFEQQRLQAQSEHELRKLKEKHVQVIQQQQDLHELRSFNPWGKAGGGAPNVRGDPYEVNRKQKFTEEQLSSSQSGLQNGDVVNEKDGMLLLDEFGKPGGGAPRRTESGHPQPYMVRNTDIRYHDENHDRDTLRIHESDQRRRTTNRNGDNFGTYERSPPAARLPDGMSHPPPTNQRNPSVPHPHVEDDRSKRKRWEQRFHNAPMPQAEQYQRRRESPTQTESRYYDNFGDGERRHEPSNPQNLDIYRQAMQREQRRVADLKRDIRNNLTSPQGNPQHQQHRSRFDHLNQTSNNEETLTRPQFGRREDFTNPNHPSHLAQKSTTSVLGTEEARFPSSSDELPDYRPSKTADPALSNSNAHQRSHPAGFSPFNSAPPNLKNSDNRKRRPPKYFPTDPNIPHQNLDPDDESPNTVKNDGFGVNVGGVYLRGSDGPRQRGGTLKINEFGQTVIREPQPSQPVYDPWGKAGAGAPRRDQQGKIDTTIAGAMGKIERPGSSAGLRRVQKDAYLNDLRQGIEESMMNKVEQARFDQEPIGELADIVRKGQVGRPKRNPATGLISNQQHLPHTDVTKAESRTSIGSSLSFLSRDRERAAVTSGDAQEYRDELVRAAEDRYRLNELEKLRNQQEAKMHYDTFPDFFGRQGRDDAKRTDLFENLTHMPNNKPRYDFAPVPNSVAANTHSPDYQHPTIGMTKPYKQLSDSHGLHTQIRRNQNPLDSSLQGPLSPRRDHHSLGFDGNEAAAMAATHKHKMSYPWASAE